MRLAAYIFLSTGIAAFALPPWAKDNTQSRIGAIYEVVCSGQGPAIDIARKEAIQSCRSSAIQQLQTKAKIKTLSIETEKEVGFHQEISEEHTFSALDCIPKKEEVENGEGSYRLWLLCQFDLMKAKVIPLEDKVEKEIVMDGTDSIKNRRDLSSLPSTKVERKDNQIISSESKLLTIATVPKCSTLMVRGTKPRVVKCNENPISIVIEPGDREIIVRANSYSPKTITLSDRRNEHGEVQVILDPL